jgi:parvulin-like peptidyl-prolyl isomerase
VVRIFMLVSSLTLLLAACGSDDAVATVNGEEISFEAVQNLQYDSEIELTTAEYVELLDVYIAWTVFTQEARDQFGIDPTEDDIQAEVTKILFESNAPTQESFLEAQNLSVNGLQLTATQFLIEAGLETALASEVPEIPLAEAEAALTEFPGDFTEICLTHILLATEAEATDVVAQLAGGAEFAELAAALSQDPTSAPVGGDLGCAPASQFIPEFGDAGLVEPIGDVFGPLQTDFGFHVMVVAARTVPTVADVVAELQSAAVFDEIDAWYIDVLGAAEVTVDPAYGVWQSGSTARLVPPTG